MNDLFVRIAEVLERGDRLDFEGGLALYQSDDLLRLGQLAERVTLSRHRRNVYYSINRHINYTNICTMQCDFCGFSRRPGHEEGYVMSVDEVVSQAEEACRAGASEIHIVGGVHPDLPFEYYREMIERIGTTCPGLHIKAFTAVEIIDLAHKCGQSVEKTLTILMYLGLGSLPGGGAEILCDKYFKSVCSRKPGPALWLEVHATAHRLGLMTNATMLYGYRETLADRVNHLLKLRALQDHSLKHYRGRFQCFVPLPFLPPGGSGNDHKTNALNDLRNIAVARLMLDNFDHIKAFWPMLGVKLAQVALCFGANDLDGTVQQYHIVEKSSSADNVTESLSAEGLQALIGEADRIPVRRNGRYQSLQE